MPLERWQMPMEKNPTPIIRPCHRVICSSGKIGGYSANGGTRLKKVLLKIESS